MNTSVFFDLNLPNATTWFYFSALLAAALFFKFTRLLSVRNLDVLTLFLFVPGLLLLLESRLKHQEPNWYGYLWLLCASGYFLVRCLWDLALVRRPALAPNLTLSGLACLAGALFVSLIAVAVRQPNDDSSLTGNAPTLLDHMQDQGEKAIQKQTAVRAADGVELRFWVERALAIVCHLSIAVGLILIGCRHFQDAHIGMAAATLYLLLPYTYLLLPYSPLQIGQWHHVWPMALIVWAVFCYRKPTLAGVFLGLAAGTVYFPVLLFPVWLSFYWGRGAGRFAATFALSAGACLAVIGATLWLEGDLPSSLRFVLSLSDWQPWREPTADGFWQGIHWAYRLPVFIAYLAFLITTAFWPTPKNLAHLLALSTALLLGLQFWYADQGGTYVFWYLPLLLLLILRPNLADRRPLPIQPETDWLVRLGRVLGRVVVRMVRPPEPARVR